MEKLFKHFEQLVNPHVFRVAGKSHDTQNPLTKTGNGRQCKFMFPKTLKLGYQRFKVRVNIPGIIPHTITDPQIHNSKTRQFCRNQSIFNINPRLCGRFKKSCPFTTSNSFHTRPSYTSRSMFGWESLFFQCSQFSKKSGRDKSSRSIDTLPAIRPKRITEQFPCL